MAKNLLQDMVKVKREKIKKEMPENAQEFYPDGVPSITQTQTQTQTQNTKKTRYSLWIVAFASVVFLFFALSFLFSKATVTINPKIQNINFNDDLSAVKGNNSSVLSFDLVSISGEESKSVQTTEMKDISDRATGVAVLYNAYGYSAQSLAIDTRLEGSNGKMYKTKTKTTIPGMTKDGKPGAVEVAIYASESGPDYNSAPLDFKIFGFKGTPKYDKMYARSKGAITGGFQGKFPVITDEKKVNIINELKVNLKTKLLEKVTEQIPSGFVLFKDAVFLNTDDSNIVFASPEDNVLSAKLKGTLDGFLFDENKLTKEIANKNIDDYDGGDVYISNIRDLTFSFSNKDGEPLSNLKNINFNLSGNAEFVWKFNVEKFKSELLGKSKSDFNQILLQYKNIDSAYLVVSPIWRRSIPGESKNIIINVNYPK